MQHVKEGLVTYEEALKNVSNPDDFALRLPRDRLDLRRQLGATSTETGTLTTARSPTRASSPTEAKTDGETDFDFIRSLLAGPGSVEPIG